MKRLLAALLAVLSLTAVLSPTVHAATTAAVFPAEIIGHAVWRISVYRSGCAW